jgi:hypothetical protein
MGGFFLKKFVAISLIIFLCISGVYAEEQSPVYHIQINIASRTLRLFEHGSLIKEYPVAVGKPATKTPVGSFVIKSKVINPYWKNVAPGPRNPLGRRWMGISVPRGSYGIHGNNVATSISTFASGGCVRMYNNDVEELYDKIGIKTPVQIVYENIEFEQDKYSNTPVLMVYPDVYKKKSAEGILKNLTANNKNITQEQAARALKLAGSSMSKPIAVCDGTALLLNNQFATNDVFIENNEVYIYYLAAMDILGMDGETIADLAIPVMEKDNKAYVSLTQIVSKTGGELKLDANNNNAYLNHYIIKINGKYLGSYKGGFDKENLLEANLMNQLGNAAVDSKEKVNLKELCKKQNWQLKADSLNKTMNIEVPLRVKVGDTYINTEFYNGRYYINSATAINIPDIQSQNLNLYGYKDIHYYDVYEMMERYECQKDYFFTTLEVFKPLDSEV